MILTIFGVKSEISINCEERFGLMINTNIVNINNIVAMEFIVTSINKAPSVVPLGFIPLFLKSRLLQINGIITISSENKSNNRSNVL